MVTVRRLLLELGVTGDGTVKTQLMDVEKTANSVRDTLINLAKEFRNLGGLSGSGLLGSSQVLTSTEQTEQKRQAQLQAREKEERKDFELVKIDLTKELIKVNKSKIDELKKVIQDTNGIIVSELKKSETLGKTITDLVTQNYGAIDEALLTLERSKNPLRVNRPLHTLTDPTARAEREKLDNEFRDQIRMVRDTLKNVLSLAKDVGSGTARTQIEKQLSDIGEMIFKIGEGGQIGGSITSQVQESNLTIRQYAKGQDRPISTKKPMLPDETIDLIEKQIEALKSGKTLEEAGLDFFTINKQSDIIKTVAKEEKKSIREFVNQILEVSGKEFSDKYGIRKSSIFADIINEREREKIKEKITEIRNEIIEQLDFDKEVEKRGFYYKEPKIISNIKSGIDSIKSKLQSGGESLKKLGIRALTKTGLFGTSEEYSNLKKMELLEELESIEKNPEATKVFKQYDIQFNGTKVDNKERERSLIEQLKLALQGI